MLIECAVCVRVHVQDCCPFIDAVIKETLRWFPATAFFTRQLLDNDVDVEGYHLPK